MQFDGTRGYYSFGRKPAKLDFVGLHEFYAAAPRHFKASCSHQPAAGCSSPSMAGHEVPAVIVDSGPSMAGNMIPPAAAAARRAELHGEPAAATSGTVATWCGPPLVPRAAAATDMGIHTAGTFSAPLGPGSHGVAGGGAGGSLGTNVVLGDGGDAVGADEEISHHHSKLSSSTDQVGGNAFVGSSRKGMGLPAAPAVASTSPAAARGNAASDFIPHAMHGEDVYSFDTVELVCLCDSAGFMHAPQALADDTLQSCVDKGVHILVRVSAAIMCNINRQREV